MPVVTTSTFLFALLACPQEPSAPRPFAAAPEPARTVVVAGRVVDLRGEGIAVANVWTKDRANPGEALRRTVTDAEGYFRMSRVPVASSYALYAAAQGRSQGVGFARGSNPTTTIELHDATTVRGQLMRADKTPVAHTIVTMAPAGRALQRRQLVGTTDQDGQFEIESVPLGLSQVSAWVAGDGLAEMLFRVTGGGDPLRLVAKEMATTSFAISVAGLPKEGGPEVTVSWRPYRDGSYVELPPPFKRPVIQGGSWACDGVPDWDYTVQLRAVGWALQPNEVRVKAGSGPHQLDFIATCLTGALQAGTPQAGTPQAGKGKGKGKGEGKAGIPCPAVVTDQAGKPVAGVEFVFRKSNGGLRAVATSDKDGRMTFDSPLAAGTKIVIYASSSGWVTDQVKTAEMYGSHDRRFLEDHECVVDPGKTIRLRVVPSTRVSGRLLREDGRPAAYVRLQLEEESLNRWPRWMSFAWTTSDRDGNYTFARLHHSDEAVRVRVEGRSGTAASDDFAIEKVGGIVRLPDLRLAAPASVEGVVADADGKPLPGVAVWLRDWDFNTGQQASGSVTEVITDKLGRYRFLGVPLGGAWLQLVGKNGRPNMQRAAKPFEVEAGERYTVDIEEK
ncbi:MAG: carboxypeptidase regulatory-like domain-containing protein [Planctomycetota bacterium]